MIDLISQQFKGSLENKIFEQVNGLNLGISSPILRAIVSRVAEQSAVGITRNVSLQTNNQLTSVPLNTIGVTNPLNIVTGNLGSTGLTSGLGNILQTQLSSQLTNGVVVQLEQALRSALPASSQNLINFGALAATLTQVLTPTINSSITSALGGVSNAIFNRGAEPKITYDSANVYTNANLTDYQKEINKQFNISTASKSLTAAQSFDINSEANKEKLVATNTGFIDPNANYPTKEYAGTSETNKLAQGDVRGTVVQEKNLNKVTARLPFNTSWEQPESPYMAEYPYNKVTETEGGHIIEVDDTPGSERIHVYHKSGTFIEIDANGSVVKRAVGSSYEIIDKNGKISIAGQADVSISGACNIFVGNDATIEVEGNTILHCHNDVTAMAGGKMNLSANEELNITAGNINIQAYNSMNVTSNVSLNLHATDSMHLHSNANVFVQAVDLFQNTTTSYHQTVTNLYEKLGGARFSQVVGAVHFKAAGDVNLDGSAVYFNTGNAADSKPSKPAKIAGVSNIGIIPERTDPVPVVIEDPVALTMADSYAFKFEEDKFTEKEYRNHKDLIVTSGFSTSVAFDKPPLEVESEAVSSLQNATVTPSDTLLSRNSLPGNYNLSPNFTLESLTNKTTVLGDTIPDNPDIKYGQIVYNLQAIALNILEPTYNIYPQMTVASAYRIKENSSPNSLHPLGQAVDIQFQGATSEEYYDYAISLAALLNYDQFILEYCSYTNNPWIHISYNTSNNRKQIMTFFNNKKYSDNIAKLR
jgi:hypothetical protein